MCELFTIGTAAITVMDVVGVASAAMGAMSSMQQAQAAQDQANYQAQVARNNAIIAQQQADDVQLLARMEESEYRTQVAGFKGKQRSILAASGFDANEDDALDILSDTAEIGEVDALKIRNKGRRDAYRFHLAAQSGQAQADLFSMQAAQQQPATAGGFAFGTGMAPVADKWMTRNRGKTIGGWKIA
tara:strand:- start:870 stop:1430 length:561 start_codon:yes stop_codon:yes gene_type:complete